MRVRGLRASEAERAALDAGFAIRSAEDVARELGQMKGVLMKLGQLVGVMVEGLPVEAQRALASLQSEAPPMAPSLAASVVAAELGAHPQRLFLRWDPVPVAAASIGQVHRATLDDGTDVAVKVQYPGVAEAVGADLDNAELLYALLSRFTFPGLDTAALVDELRARMGDELDYRTEAAHQADFHRRFAGHPTIRVPAVIDRYVTARVLVSEWVDGQSFAAFGSQAPEADRQSAAETVFRFAQAGIHAAGVFNGDGHPGNYRFHPGGSVTFLDFGLVKRWEAGEWERLSPCLDALIFDRDPEAVVAAMEASGVLHAGHGLDPAAVVAYVQAPYLPYLTDRFRFTPAFVPDALGRMLDLKGSAEVVRRLDLPPSFLLLSRVIWAVSAVMGRLGAEGPWRGILAEYRHGGPPATELGRRERAWAEACRGGAS